MLQYIWLIPIFPLLGFLVNGGFGLWMVRQSGRRPPKPFVFTVACGSVFLSFLVSVGCFLELLKLDERLYEANFFTWISGLAIRTSAGELAQLNIFWGVQLDPLSAVMILVVTGIGFLIHVYSIGYMSEEDGFYRFFAYLNLFMFMMLTLVLANNFLMMFVGWEGVGLCSYLLIGYYTKKRSAGDAAKKAFVVNRVGDFAFILGIMMIFTSFGSLDLTEVMEKVAWQFSTPESSWGVLSWIALLLFVGAAGKSAQIPLYVWLPDAMEGPTPVSALIHAATMVTAGVYMVARSSAIYSRAPEVLLIVAAVGIFTALMAGSIALFQQDIKRVLAYSTVSQLGYMFAALGVGAVAAGVFHLMTHAFFKALLFLGSGSVIMALHHEQDMRNMGGLRTYLPITCSTMWIATFAIVGVPGLSGFFSKDEILWRSFSNPNGHMLIWFVGIIVAGMTAFYMMRMMFLTFHGKERMSEKVAHHVRESPWVMTCPLILLAIGSAFAGYLGLPAWLGSNRFEHFLEPVFRTTYHPPIEGHYGYEIEILITVISVALAGIGIYLAYYFFLKNTEKSALLLEKFRGIHTVISNKYYVDEGYDLLFVGEGKGVWRFFGVKNWGRFLSAFDSNVIDGAVNGSATITRISAWISGQVDIHIVDRLVNLVAEIAQLLSSVFRWLHTGLFQRFALAFVVGLICIISLYLYLGV